MKFATLILSAFIGLAPPTAEASDYQPDQEWIYKTIGKTELKLNVFNPEGHESTDNRSVIIFFFGGGWAGGTPKQFYEQSQYFADLGMVAISADYRVRSRHQVSPFECVADAKSAIRWVRQHADELGIDPDKVVASGGSAGGHIAACAGIIEGYDEPSEDLSISSVPNAMVLFNPVTDTTENGLGVDRVGQDRKFEISPNHHIRPGIVPTIVFHGTADTTVPFENVERFDRLMKAAANQSELVPFEGMGHGFFNGKFFRPKTEDTTPYWQGIERTKAFLTKNGFLPVGTSTHIESHQFRLGSLFKNGMVLQRNMPVPVWGEGNPGSNITVAFEEQKVQTTVDSSGKWMVKLNSLQANTKGQKMTISSTSPLETAIISDILVGEVWICSGQSNMQMGAASVPEIVSLSAQKENIRSFQVKNTVAFEEQDYCQGEWIDKPPSSAVATAFAYFLERSAEVPVGIIQTAWGSSSLEAWMPREMTSTVPHFKTMMEEFDANTEAKQRIETILNGPKPWSRQDDIYLRRQSNILFNAMMAPLAPYACQGIVWYQGERNTQSMHGMIEEPWYSRNSGMIKYGDTLKKWVEYYRQYWNQSDLNVLIVMLPGYGKILDAQTGQSPQSPNAHSWAWMRESQLKVLDLPNTAVVNTIDLGDVKDIHPKDKLPIGQRLALLAGRDTLGQKVEAQGPSFKKIVNRKHSLVLHFNHAKGLTTNDGKAPTGFWVADDTGTWVPAEASIKKQSVTLRSSKLKKPLYVRYAFAGKPEVNLVNGADLPAYPFRTDRFDP